MNELARFAEELGSTIEARKTQLETFKKRVTHMGRDSGSGCSQVYNGSKGGGGFGPATRARCSRADGVREGSRTT